MSFGIVNGREAGKKVTDLCEGLALAYAITVVIEAATEAKFEPLCDLGWEFLKSVFE